MRTLLICLVGVGVLIAGCSNADWEAFGRSLESDYSQESNEDSEKIAEQLRKAFGLEPEHAGPKRAEPTKVTGYCEQITPIITKAITPTDRNVRTLAVSLAKYSPGQYNIWQVCMIWYGLKNTWSYVNDPRGSEYVASAGESAGLLAGDCDDFAILMASMVEAVGGSCRIVAAQSKTSGHMFSEVFLASTKNEADSLINDINNLDQKRSREEKFFYYRGDSEGFWLNLDWFADYPGGPYFPSTFEILIYPDGRCRQNKLPKN
jgi:hypothetical protein